MKFMFQYPDFHGIDGSMLDAGPVILQARVPVLPGDDPETLAARVLAREHEIYPRALAQVARDLAGRGRV